MKKKEMHNYKKANKINRTNYKKIIQIIQILPILFTVLIIPLIVRLKPITLSGIRALYNIGDTVDADIFAYYKMFYFVGLTFAGLCISSNKVPGT